MIFIEQTEKTLYLYDNLPSFRPSKNKAIVKESTIEDLGIGFSSFVWKITKIKMSLRYIPFTSAPQFVSEEPKKASPCWHILTGDVLRLRNKFFTVVLF